MSKQTALLIIDMQIDSFEVPGNPTYREAELLANIRELVRKAHTAGTPVIYIQHQEQSGPLTVGTWGWQILPTIAPSEGGRSTQRMHFSRQPGRGIARSQHYTPVRVRQPQ